MDLLEKAKKSMETKKEIIEKKIDEKTVLIKAENKSKEVIISLKDDFIGETNELELFLKSLPKYDIDGVSSFYNIATGMKRIHRKGAITTKNYMIDAIIKRFELSKTKQKVNK